MNQSFRRLRGLKDLLVDAVDHGAGAIETVHLATAKRTFDVLEHIPAVDEPTKVVHAIHDASVQSVYGTVRFVAKTVGAVLDVALDAVDPRTVVRADESPESGATPPVREPSGSDGSD